jgi:predicted nucleic acid-binding protein
VNLFVDTSVWSLAFRRDAPAHVPEVERLREALGSQEPVYTTGIVLQELLQGFTGPKAREAILDHFATLPMITPERDDHVRAAGVRNECRRHGVQLGTIDALLVQVCLRHDLVMLTADADVRHAARHVALRVWNG